MLRIRHFRLIKNWSQSELSRKSGVSQSFINDIEAGAKQPTITTLNKLAKALEVKVSELLGECEQAATKEVV